MKEFFKKHIAVFCVIMVGVAFLSNVSVGVLQEKYADSLTVSYFVEAVCKFILAFLLIVLMIKWKLIQKTPKKYLWWGLLAGIPGALWIVTNLLPLKLVNPQNFQVSGDIIFSVVLAKAAVGIMEEAGIRGILLPMLCEKWSNRKSSYMKAALTSSILFGCMHFSWSIRQIIFNQNLSLASFMGNLNQVFYTFCFGMLAAGVTLYAGSIIPMVVWHSLIGISAEIYPGLMSYGTYTYHVNHNPLTLQNLFEKYGILSGVESSEIICKVIIDIIFLIAGIVLVRKAEKRMGNEYASGRR